MIITSLNETKDFNKIKTVNRGQRQYGKKPKTHAKMPMNQRCRYCGSSHPPRICLAYGKKCAEYITSIYFYNNHSVITGNLKHCQIKLKQ